MRIDRSIDNGMQSPRYRDPRVEPHRESRGGGEASGRRRGGVVDGAAGGGAGGLEIKENENVKEYENRAEGGTIGMN
jgi:hypothetical protein